MPNRRRIGADAERQWAKYLRGWLDPSGKPILAARGQQFRGSPGSPDVESSLKKIHFEICRDQQIVQRRVLESKLEQAERDAGTDQLPVVVWKLPRRPWMATIGVVLTGYSHRNSAPLIGTRTRGSPGATGRYPATMLADDFLRVLGCRREGSDDQPRVASQADQSRRA